MLKVQFNFLFFVDIQDSVEEILVPYTSSWENSAIHFIKKYIVPAAKRIGADIFEINAPEIGEVVSGLKKKTVAKDVGTKTVRKCLAQRKNKFKRRTRTVISRKSISKTSRLC